MTATPLDLPLLPGTPPAAAPRDSDSQPPTPRATALARPPVPAVYGRRLERPGTSRAALRAWLIAEIFAPAFRPRRTSEPCWRWADRVGYPVEGGGRYSSRKKPHVRRFMECTQDHRIREQHIMKASRAGYTQGVLVRIGHKARHDPGNVQLTIGSKENSKVTAAARLLPALTHLGLIGRPEDDPDDATSSLIKLPSSTIRVTGAFTALAFRTHMVELCVNDDCEVVTEIPGIGSPADGGRSRIRGREGAQLLSISRPADWASPHHRDVATGTLEFALWPCPHCGTYQEMTVNGESLVDQLRIEDNPDRSDGPPINPPRVDLAGYPVKPARLGRLQFAHCRLLPGTGGDANPSGWDYNRIVAETYYECVSGCAIHETAPLTDTDLMNPLCSFTDEVRDLHRAGIRLTHKQAMALSVRYLPGNPHAVPADGGGPGSKRSEHNSDLLSLDFDMTWGHLAKKFAERAHDAGALRNFYNEHLGLPFKDRSQLEATDRDLIECRGPYTRGTIPFEPHLLTLCADTQDAFWVWMLVAGRLSTDLKSWREFAVVDWGTAFQQSDVLDLLKQPAHLAADPSQKFFPGFGLIDAGGHRTDSVYELHFDSGGKLFPSYGRDDRTLQMRPTWRKPIVEAWRGATFDICWFWDDFWQRRLNGCIRQASDIRECIEKHQLDPSAKGLPPRLRTPGLPQDVHLRELERQLLAEKLVKGEWTKTGTQDLRDALKLCLAAADFALPDIADQCRAREAAAKKTSP